MINMAGLIGTKAMLLKQFHMPPSEVDMMAYWEYEMFIEELNKLVKAENDTQEKEMSKYDIRGTMNAMKGGMKAPKMPGIPK